MIGRLQIGWGDLSAATAKKPRHFSTLHIYGGASGRLRHQAAMRELAQQVVGSDAQPRWAIIKGLSTARSVVPSFGESAWDAAQHALAPWSGC